MGSPFGFWVFCILTIGGVFLMVMQAFKGKIGVSMLLAWGVTTTFCFTITTLAAIDAFGRGHVPFKVEDLTQRLDAGVAYQVIASSKEEMENDYVLLVKKIGAPDFYAMRVKEVPPRVFTLVNDKPVAIPVLADSY